MLIGEIRDSETAEIAIQASLTGHLVFSTLHTNDAPSALTRLVDMGIEPYLVASSLEAVLAQRLVRTICKALQGAAVGGARWPLCKKRFGDKLPEVLYKGRGCRQCQGTGYRGRLGIFEMMVVTDDVRSLIIENASAPELRKVAVKQGMRSLRDDGFRHLPDGRTTIEEIMRVTKDETFTMSDFDGPRTCRSKDVAMATFLYKAIDAQGRQVADKLVAADRASAIDAALQPQAQSGLRRTGRRIAQRRAAGPHRPGFQERGREPSPGSWPISWRRAFR